MREGGRGRVGGLGWFESFFGGDLMSFMLCDTPPSSISIPILRVSFFSFYFSVRASLSSAPSYPSLDPYFPAPLLSFSFPSIVPIPHHSLAYLHLLVTTIRTFLFSRFRLFFLYLLCSAFCELPRLHHLVTSLARVSLPSKLSCLNEASRHLFICLALFITGSSQAQWRVSIAWQAREWRPASTIKN